MLESLSRRNKLYLVFIIVLVATIILLAVTLVQYTKCATAFAAWRTGNLTLCEFCENLGEIGIIGR